MKTGLIWGSTKIFQDTFCAIKYLEIKKQKPTIFANNCWGGFTYNSLCLSFNSPFINLFLTDSDYIKFLKQPKFYLEQNLKFNSTGYSVNQNRHYPIASCNDILLHFNHYDDFNCANCAWKRRKSRINWENIFYVMQTTDPKFEEQFCDLPYKKKFCFVPYKTNKKENFQIDLNIDTPFSYIVNGLGSGKFIYYDPFEMLSTGTIKKIF